MTKISTLDISAGIMHPAMAHKWRVLIENRKLLTMQATKIEINMLDAEVTVWVEQPAAFAQDMLDDIYALRNRSFTLTIELLDGDYNILGKIGGWGKMKNHQFILDYGLSETATHKLVFSYTPSA